MTSQLFQDVRTELQTFCRVPTSPLYFVNSQLALQVDGTTPTGASHLTQYESSPNSTAFTSGFDCRRHVFANVWDRRLDPRKLEGEDEDDSPEVSTIAWRQWPPDIPHVPGGVKIPVELISPRNGYQPKFFTDAVPIECERKGFYNSLKGMMNTSQTKSIACSPPALLFLNIQKGQFYKVKVQLKNIGTIPRRVKMIPPQNNSFDIFWQSATTTVIPGLTVTLNVNFRPNSNDSFNELLFVVVEGDGALTIPLVSAAVPPPILEVEEWDCGCSVLLSKRCSSFEVKNIGSEARFWFLTENEFHFEYIALEREFHKTLALIKTRSEIAYRKEQAALKNPTPSATVVETIRKTKHKIRRSPFKIHPIYFRLQKNQKIKIKVKFMPKTAGLHYEKIAMMCDNGEVRWIALKGMGIDISSRRLIELQAFPSWTAPPIDLPSDVLNCRHSLDLGDLLPGDTGNSKYKVVNKSCIPLYYFWSVRPLTVDNSRVGQHQAIQHFFEGSIQPTEWADWTKHLVDGQILNDDQVDVKIYPSQGLLRPKDETLFSLSAICPQETGYFACIVSLFVEQVNESERSVIKPMLQALEDMGSNDVPIHLDDLQASMPMDPHAQGDQVFLGHHKKCHAHDMDSRKSSQRATTTESFERIPQDSEPRFSRGSLILAGSEIEENMEGSISENRGSRGYHLGEGDNLRITPPRGHEIPSNDDDRNDELVTIQDFFQYPERIFSPPDVNKVPQPYAWLGENPALRPIAEIEVWLRSVPLEIDFNPPFIIASGVTKSKIEKAITATNSSPFDVEISFKSTMGTSACVIVEPSTFILKAQQKINFNASVLFERHGKTFDPLSGTMRICRTNKTTECSIPCSISTIGPFLSTNTPIINFGVIKQSTEKMQTLAVTNTGDRPARWIASLSTDGLISENYINLSPFNEALLKQQFLRVWPKWGVLEPKETFGINVYFSAEIVGQIASAMTVMVEGIPESTIHIPICAEVQTTALFLEEYKVNLNRKSLELNKFEDHVIVLTNPTGNPVAFAWKLCLVGRQSHLLGVDFSPSKGIVPPKGTQDCIFTVVGQKELLSPIKNAYALCFVDGMKEPLILKVSSD